LEGLSDHDRIRFIRLPLSRLLPQIFQDERLQIVFSAFPSSYLTVVGFVIGHANGLVIEGEFIGVAFHKSVCVPAREQPQTLIEEPGIDSKAPVRKPTIPENKPIYSSNTP
jgi:hypothetical protein